MLLRFLSLAFLLQTASANDGSFLRRKTFSEGEVDVDGDDRVVLHCKSDLNHEECMAKLQEFSKDKVKIIHKLKIVDSIAISISKKDQSILNAIEATKMFDIFSDPIRRPMYIKESVRVEDGRNLQFFGQSVPYGIDMVKAQEVWQQHSVRGQGVKVCVMDTGLYRQHSDFQSSNLSGYNGREAVTPWSADGEGHGTHVTGTIAASDNNAGVVGVAPDCEIFTVRVFDNNGNFYGSDVVAAAEACQAAGAKIISMSLGGPSYDFSEKRVFDNLFDDGILPIAAAGNDGTDDYSYPASYPKVMSVAAVNSNRNHASFSQYNDRVDIAAPGVNVRSTWNNGRYSSISGTSMATPHVSGVAALLLSKKPDATPTQLKDAMTGTAENPNTSGRDDKFGHGIVNALNAITALAGGSTLPPDTGNPGGECSSSEVDFQFELNTDDYGYETSWDLRDVGSGSTVASEASGKYSNNQKYSIQKCLNGDRCYALTLFDAYGDGLCCGQGNQGFLVRVNGEIIKSTTDFRQSLEIAGIGGPQCSGNNPNPTNPPVGPPSNTPAPVPSPTNPPTPPPVSPPTPPPTQRECCFLVWCWSC